VRRRNDFARILGLYDAQQRPVHALMNAGRLPELTLDGGRNDDLAVEGAQKR
jgi:hypothetical protein